MQNQRLTVDPATLKPLLSLIAKGESSGNYNAYFGHGSNTSIDFTKMSIADVQKWQAKYVQQGSASSAVGKYQIVDTTLSGLVQRLGIDTKQKFDQRMQDKLAIALIERRGVNDYINNELTANQFAANLAKEWASLPRIIGGNPSDSYYASDGLNKSRISISDTIKAVTPISAKK